MFTIKHIDDYGNEDLFQATSVRLDMGSSDSTEPSGDRPGVKVEGVKDRDFTGAQYPFRSPGAARETTNFEAAIFVMNENGATVAKYLL